MGPISLDDYRKRYATYRSDTDLQLLHQSKPMIAERDDQEINSIGIHGKRAQNHSSDEGSFYKRKNNLHKKGLLRNGRPLERQIKRKNLEKNLRLEI